MKKLTLTLLFVASGALAQDTDVYGNDSSTQIYGSGSSSGSYGTSESRGYESSTGNRYEYDLSDPGDQLEYGVDLDAQMRDSTSVNPTRELDRGLGEYGGGIYD